MPNSALPGRWVKAIDLRVRDILFTCDDRRVPVTNVSVRQVKTTVYNLQLAELEHYAVGHTGILVHNTSGSTRPPLRSIHPEISLRKSSLDFWGKKSNQEIIDSLKPGAKEPLITYPDGRIAQGNTRIKILRDRGVDVDQLPRQIHKPDDSMFPDLQD